MRTFSLSILVFLLLTPFAAHAAEEPETGVYTTSFKTAPRYANANTIMKRMMLGEVYRGSVVAAQKNGTNLNAFTVQPDEENWDVYVPPDYSPGEGYGVIVWIPELPAMTVPDEWKKALGEHKLIYVSPRNAGKDQPTLDRRVPLALFALNGIINSYKIDPKRIYIGGNGSGAEVAGNLALGFADVFQGSVLMRDGPDLGNTDSPVPVKTLMDFARQDAFVFLAPRDDPAARRASEGSALSLQQFCIPNVKIFYRPESGDENLLDSGLKYIDSQNKASVSATCIAELADKVDNAISETKKAVESQAPSEALDVWRKNYQKFGGLIDQEMQAIKRKIEAKQKQRTPSASLSRD